MAYRLLRALSRLLLAIFYRRIEVVGREHIPARGPVIIAANHHNALVDPMLVMAALPRPLVILAAAPLFHNPVIAPLLRLVGALPVLRRQEGIADPIDAAAYAAALERGRTGRNHVDAGDGTVDQLAPPGSPIVAALWAATFSSRRPSERTPTS